MSGLLPIVDLLKSEYAVIQSLALTALQLLTEDGQSLSAFFILLHIAKTKDDVVHRMYPRFFADYLSVEFINKISAMRSV